MKRIGIQTAWLPMRRDVLIDLYERIDGYRPKRGYPPNRVHARLVLYTLAVFTRQQSKGSKTVAIRVDRPDRNGPIDSRLWIGGAVFTTRIDKPKSQRGDTGKRANRKERTMAYDGEVKDFENPPEGEHDCVIVGWRDQGWRPSTYKGVITHKHKATLLYESLTANMENGEPFVIWDWLNIAFGTNATLTQRRKKITDVDKLEDPGHFEPEDLVCAPGIRVKVFIEHGQGKNDRVYVNVVSVRRNPDQTPVEFFTPLEIIEEPPEEYAQEPPDDTNQPTQQQPDHSRPINSAPLIQSAPAVQASKGPTQEQVSYVGQIIDSLEEPGYLSNAQELRDWLASKPPLNELAKHAKELEDMAGKHSVDLPKFETHPFSTGDDDLPF